MTRLGTVRLDGATVRLRREHGGELMLPLAGDPTAESTLAEALRLARDVWHPGVTLGAARPVGGGAELDVREHPASIAAALRLVLGGERGACLTCGAGTRAERCARCRAEGRVERPATAEELSAVRRIGGAA